MKRFSISFLFALLAYSALAQGTIIFANHGISTFGQSFQTPIYGIDGSTPLDNSFEVGLYIPLGGGSPVTLSILVPGSVTPIAGNGLFSGPTIALPDRPSLTGVVLLVAAWKIVDGSTLRDASGKGGEIGWSDYFNVGLGGGTIRPADIASMPAFNIFPPVPEPASATLLVCGILFGCRRLPRASGATGEITHCH